MGLLNTIEYDLSWLFNKGFKAFLAFAKEFVKEFTDNQPEVIGKIVAKAVADAETSGKTGPEKLLFAVEEAGKNLLEAEIKLSEAALRGAIEMAVATLNAQQKAN